MFAAFVPLGSIKALTVHLLALFEKMQHTPPEVEPSEHSTVPLFRRGN